VKANGALSRVMARLVPAGLLLALAGLFMVPAAPVLAAPVLSVSPTSGAVGTEVTIKGTVFDSYKGDIITITFNGVEIPQYSPYQIPDSGSFEIPFTIPAAMAPNSYIIRIETAVGSSQFSASTVFRVDAPALSLNVTEGKVGTSVTTSGRGFYAGSTVTVYFHNPGEESTGTSSIPSWCRRPPPASTPSRRATPRATRRRRPSPSSPGCPSTWRPAGRATSST
jgi:hypothetical protein